MLHLNRRRWISTTAAGAAGLSMSGWGSAIAEAVTANTKQRRHVILLWMSGGPTQTDTFDMKPDHENGGEFAEIATNAPGVRFSEHLPTLAKHADRLAIVRSLSTKEGDHSRGSHLMRTGQRPMGPIDHPSLACSLAKELGEPTDVLPGCVSVAPYAALGGTTSPGFLGPKHTPLIVNAAAQIAADAEQGHTELRIDSLKPTGNLSEERLERRREMWQRLQSNFVGKHAGGAADAQQTVYQRSMRLMNDATSDAFDLTKEPDALRTAYGRGVFGQGCLMARRLVERGVPVVEVTLGGWDTHSDIFNSVEKLSAELDAGWGTLMGDLDSRGLLDSTTILWMGEFGRTPKINGSTGRDHFPGAWSCVFGGGGIAGGQAYGRTSPDGMKVEENPVSAVDVLATLSAAAGVDPSTENESNLGRPIKLVDGDPIREILA